jgi:hypothetical protein
VAQYYKLDTGSDYGVDIRIVVGHVYPSFSLSDCEVAKSRKVPRNISTKEFVAQQNDFWGLIRRVGLTDPRCLTLNSNSLSARSLVPRLGTWRLKEKAAQLSLVRKQRVKEYVSTTTGCRNA